MRGKGKAGDYTSEWIYSVEKIEGRKESEVGVREGSDHCGRFHGKTHKKKLQGVHCIIGIGSVGFLRKVSAWEFAHYRKP